MSQNDVQILKNVLEEPRVDVNYMRPPGTTALHQACIRGNLECVQLLVERGADLNLKDWQGFSPLKLASLNGHFDVAEYLLSRGTSIVNDIRDGFQLLNENKPSRTRRQHHYSKLRRQNTIV